MDQCDKRLTRSCTACKSAVTRFAYRRVISSVECPKTFRNGDGPSRERPGVQPGEEIRYQPGFGNRNLFFEWKSRAATQGKVTRTNGKYYRAYAEAHVVN
jgi:hypothetical protein